MSSEQAGFLRGTPASGDGLGPLLVELTTQASSASPVTLPKNSDIFGQLVVGARDNQIEVHLDDTNYATYLSTTQTGGGGATQADGHVTFSSGTGTNGRSQAISLDTIHYRPMHEIYAGWTASFTTGVAGSFQRIGMADSAYLNGLVVGYENTSFGITWFQGGVATTVPQASWDDPCLGGASSLYTRGGTPEALDPTMANVYRVRVGLLGHAQMILEVYSPDGDWITVHTFKQPNLTALPTFSNFDLPMIAEVRKTSGATDVAISSACWAGGTTSQSARLSDTITDRSLATTVRAVIEGKTQSGTYTKVAVNSQGRLQVTNDAVGATGAAVPTSAQLVGGTNGGTLRALALDASGNLVALPLPSGAATDAMVQAVRDRLPSGLDTDGSLKVTDAYTGGETLASQAGANAVLTFTFAAARDLIWVRCQSGTGYCDPFGGTPASGTGIYCEDGIPQPLTVRATTVKVWAPSGSTVYVWGYSG